MPLNLDTNPASYFQQGPYPGQANFYEALKYYMGDLLGPGGKGPGQLAQAGATDRAAGGYYGDSPLFDPGSGAAQAGAQGMFGNLLTGESAARNAALAATAQNQQKDAGGIANVASAYGSDIGNTLQAQSQLKAAESAQSGGMLGDIMAGIEMAGGIGSEFVAPGNPFGAQMTMQGAGLFLGGGGGGGGMGGGLLSSFMPGGKASGGSAGASVPNLPSGFTMGSGSFDPSTLQGTGIDPSQIAAYGPSLDEGGSSFLSMLQGLGGWF